MSALGETAQKLVADHKGLLATDATEESTNKRMEAVGIKPTAELRKQLRELLLTTDGFEKDAIELAGCLDWRGSVLYLDYGEYAKDANDLLVADPANLRNQLLKYD